MSTLNSSFIAVILLLAAALVKVESGYAPDKAPKLPEGVSAKHYLTLIQTIWIDLITATDFDAFGYFAV